MASHRIIGLEVLALGVALLPAPASALSLVQALGFLDIFIGLFLTVSIVMFVGALIVYFTRYGTMHRENTFPYMQASITIVFVLIVLLALIHYFQRHTETLRYIVGIIILILVVMLIAHLSVGNEEDKAPDHP